MRARARMPLISQAYILILTLSVAKGKERLSLFFKGMLLILRECNDRRSHPNPQQV
jgi:hypothetical protein